MTSENADVNIKLDKVQQNINGKTSEYYSSSISNNNNDNK